MRIKRVAIVDKGRCSVQDADLSESLQGSELLVRNLKTLISPGTELSMFTKIHRGFADPASTYARYPFYPGYSAVGVVVKPPTDPAWSTLREGDTVAYKGKHGTYSVSGEMAQCIPVPRIPGSTWSASPSRRF